ncbi:YebC/PmpR family DNA-binding transcriptional regulator, partial [Bartonella sp. AC53GZZY]
TIWKATTLAPIDEEKALSVLRLISTLEEDDDVQNVYANFDISDEILAKLSV